MLLPFNISEETPYNLVRDMIDGMRRWSIDLLGRPSLFMLRVVMLGIEGLKPGIPRCVFGGLHVEHVQPELFTQSQDLGSVR